MQKQPEEMQRGDAEIESVSASTWKYIAQERRILSFVLLVAAIGATIVLIYVSTRIEDMEGLPFLPVIILFTLYGMVYAKMHGKFMEQFAKANGFIYWRGGSAEEEEGIIFQRGHGKRVSHLVEGVWESNPVRLCNYEYSVKQGKNETRYRYTIFRTILGKSMPRIFLDAHGKGNWKTEWWIKSGLKKISLESNDFEKIYDLYITEGEHIPALQIFAPDLMEKLIHLRKHFDVEIVDDKLYIYKGGYVGKKKDLEEMYGVAKIVIENIRNVVERMVQ